MSEKIQTQSITEPDSTPQSAVEQEPSSVTSDETEYPEAATKTQEESSQAESSRDELPPPLRADSALSAGVQSFDEYMTRKGFSENTIKAFRNDLKIFVKFMDPKTPLHRIQTKHIEEFLEWLQHERGRPCSPKTLARRITTLKVYFSWLHGVGVIGTDPAEPVVQQTVRTPLPTILSEHDVKALVEAATSFLSHKEKPDARPFVLVSLLIQSGMKKAECARLLISDVSVDNPNMPELFIRYAEERHAHKNRSMMLDPDIVPILSQYLDVYKPENFLFNCTPRNLEYVLDEVGQKAGVAHTQVGFETLRWTCMVRDFRAGMTEDRLRQKMGLSKISWRETRNKLFQLTGLSEQKTETNN